MKTSYYIPLISVALLGSVCERTLEFEQLVDKTTSSMVINCFAVADTSLVVYLSSANSVAQTPAMQYVDYEHSITVEDDGKSFDYRFNEYYKKTALLDAQVKIEINGQESYNMRLDEEKFCYICSYVPKEGDRIMVRATADGEELSAETIVPRKPRIEVTDHEVIPENPYREVNNLSFPTDTIMRLTCRIHDSGGANYYRLRIRSERDTHPSSGHVEDDRIIIDYIGTNYSMQDIFFSTDELFMDNRLTTNFGGWQAGFSNVFDNSLINGKSYTFTVESPKIKYSSPSSTIGIIDSTTVISDKPQLPARVMVELQAISPELYRYLKSMQVYRIIQNERDAEPVQIYSNVQNGWGILGALSYDRHCVEYGE